MIWRTRHVFALLAATVVLAVSVSCTSAGCLMQAALSGPQGASRPCCAMAHGREGHSGGGDNKHQCPLCQGPLFIGKSVEARHLDLQVAAQVPALFEPVFQGAAGDLGISVADPSFAVSCLSSPGGTLLGLHCALLT